jgi:hypothetical protein
VMSSRVGVVQASKADARGLYESCGHRAKAGFKVEILITRWGHLYPSVGELNGVIERNLNEVDHRRTLTYGLDVLAQGAVVQSRRHGYGKRVMPDPFLHSALTVVAPVAVVAAAAALAFAFFGGRKQ